MEGKKKKKKGTLLCALLDRELPDWPDMEELEGWLSQVLHDCNHVLLSHDQKVVKEVAVNFSCLPSI